MHLLQYIIMPEELLYCRFQNQTPLEVILGFLKIKTHYIALMQYTSREVHWRNWRRKLCFLIQASGLDQPDAALFIDCPLNILGFIHQLLDAQGHLD